MPNVPFVFVNDTQANNQSYDIQNCCSGVSAAVARVCQDPRARLPTGDVGLHTTRPTQGITLPLNNLSNESDIGILLSVFQIQDLSKHLDPDSFLTYF